jgi:hypothetical protein
MPIVMLLHLSFFELGYYLVTMLYDLKKKKPVAKIRLSRRQYGIARYSMKTENGRWR